jgi:hypothetical protein
VNAKSRRRARRVGAAELRDLRERLRAHELESDRRREAEDAAARELQARG